MPVSKKIASFSTRRRALRAKSVASLTGRIGYAWDRFLGYVKFGGAWERDELTLNFFNGFVATASDTRSGWTIGIGAEYAFTNWVTAFVEYDYYDFGSRSHSFICDPVGCLLPIHVKETKNVFKVGLNFLFNAGKGPVAAKDQALGVNPSLLSERDTEPRDCQAPGLIYWAR